MSPVLGCPDKLNAQFTTFNPPKLTGQRNIFAIDQDFERLRHIPQRNRREPRACETHVFQFAEYATSIIANQQADRAADLVAWVGISSVVHGEYL